MAEPNNLRLYKNATLDGTPIPYDILLLAGLIIKAFTPTASNDHVIPADADILIIYGDPVADCLIQLDDDAVIPADATYQAGLVYIPAQSVKIIDSNGATSFGIIAYDGGSGQIVIECAQGYTDTRKPKQVSRG